MTMKKTPKTVNPINEGIGIVRSAETLQGELRLKYNVVLHELKELENVSARNYISNKRLSIPGLNVINIEQSSNIQEMVTGLAWVYRMHEDYIKVGNALKIKQLPVFRYEGNTYEDLLHDVELRIKIITNHTRKQELTEAKVKMEKYFTREDGLSMLLNDVTTTLNL